MNDHSIHVIAEVIGKPAIGVDTVVTPNATIQTMLRQIAQELALLDLPSEFYAYAAVLATHERRPGDAAVDAKTLALYQRDPETMAEFMAPHARLDPARTVADYYCSDESDNARPPKAISVLVDWSPAAWHEYFVRMRHTEAQYFADQQREVLGVYPRTRFTPRPKERFHGIRVNVLLTDMDGYVVSVLVEPREAVGTLLELLSFELHWLGSAYDVDAYVAKQGGQWPLKAVLSAGVAIADDSVAKVEACLVPRNKLDPAKKVGDYFAKGDGVGWGTIAILLVGSGSIRGDDAIGTKTKSP